MVLKSGSNSFRAEMTVAIYRDRYGNRLDLQRFSYVRDCEPVKKIRNDHGEERLTLNGTWVKRWRH